METLQRLQPLDFMLVLLWAAIVGWGLYSGMVRQLGMLLGVYVAAIGAASLYQPVAQGIALAFGRDFLAQFEFFGYVGSFVVVLGLVSLIIWRAYPMSRIGRKFGGDNVVGAALGGIWGVLLLIAVLTMLRYYAVTPWRGQESTQLNVRGQIEMSQVAPVLEVVLAPLWQIMTPWFPQAVPPRR